MSSRDQSPTFLIHHPTQMAFVLKVARRLPHVQESYPYSKGEEMGKGRIRNIKGLKEHATWIWPFLKKFCGISLPPTPLPTAFFIPISLARMGSHRCPWLKREPGMVKIADFQLLYSRKARKKELANSQWLLQGRAHFANGALSWGRRGGGGGSEIWCSGEQSNREKTVGLWGPPWPNQNTLANPKTWLLLTISSNQLQWKGEHIPSPGSLRYCNSG